MSDHHTYPVLITIAKWRKRYYNHKCTALELTYTNEFSNLLRLKCDICPSQGMCKAFKSSARGIRLL